MIFKSTFVREVNSYCWVAGRVLGPPHFCSGIEGGDVFFDGHFIL
jgi:hypothetical protein